MSSQPGRFTKNRLLAVASLLLVTVTAVVAWHIYTFSQRSTSTSADVAIVLGAAVYRERPSPVFRERINHGVSLYHAGIVDYLIFTGGIGRGDSLSEAEVARTYAMGLGVPPQAIFVEAESEVTQENLANACRIMNEEQWHRALIVSDPLHMKRAVTMARDMGIEAYPAPTPTSRYRTWWSKSRFLASEVVLFIAYRALEALRFGERCTGELSASVYWTAHPRLVEMVGDTGEPGIGTVRPQKGAVRAGPPPGF